MSNLLNQAALARLFEVTPKTVRAWEAQGCPVAEPSSRRGQPALYSVAAVLRWREERSAMAASRDVTAMDKEEARRRKLAAEAALVEIDLAQRRGEVAEVAIIAKVVGGALATCRSRLLQVGATVAPRLELATDAASAKEIVDDAIHEALAEISGNDFWVGEGKAER